MARSPNKTAAQWQALVDEFLSSGVSEQVFCEQRDIKLNTMRKWRYQFAAELRKPTSEKPRKGFIKVSTPSTESNTSSTGAAVLCIGSDIRLECPTHFDATSLAQLTLAVHHGC